MEKIRIQKIMSDSGVCSRRKAEEYISEGRVKVNGRPCKLGDKALAGKDIITLDGEKIYVAKKRQLYYIMLHKPRGYVTTMSDELDRKCVTELLTKVPEFILLADLTKTQRDCYFSQMTEILPMISCTLQGMSLRLIVLQ